MVQLLCLDHYSFTMSYFITLRLFRSYLLHYGYNSGGSFTHENSGYKTKKVGKDACENIRLSSPSLTVTHAYFYFTPGVRIRYFLMSRDYVHPVSTAHIERKVTTATATASTITRRRHV